MCVRTPNLERHTNKGGARPGGRDTAICAFTHTMAWARPRGAFAERGPLASSAPETFLRFGLNAYCARSGTFT